MDLPERKKRKCQNANCFRMSLQSFVYSFFGFSGFVVAILFLLTSKISLTVNSSINMKDNIVRVVGHFENVSKNDSKYGNISSLSFPKNVTNLVQRNRTNGDRERALLGNSSLDDKRTNGKYDIDIAVTIKDKVNKFGNKINSDISVRQNTCDSCFLHNFNYVIQNENICKIVVPNQNIDLIILIFTAHENIEARSALRATWLSITKNNTASVRYAFLLGEVKDATRSETVLNENKQYRDIIKEDFLDTYENLTYKTIMGFKWATTQCAHARFVMKTDNDMFVNVPNLLKVLNGPDKQLLNSSVIGHCKTNAQPIRNKKSKWYASHNSYPEKKYPRFCSGTGYVTSMTVATALYNISPSVPFFHLEDVYISLCIKKLGLKLMSRPGFRHLFSKNDVCFYKREQVITVHHVSPNMLRSIWTKECTKT